MPDSKVKSLQVDLVNSGLTIITLVILSISIFLRIFALDNIPGISGDEAWYGIVALEILSGEVAIDLHTPSGNLLNPFYILPVMASHFFFEPSFLLLRIPSLISGLLLILLSYYLSKSFLDKKSAMITTLIVASLPVNIAYSRFGWDTSQTALISLIVIYCLLNQRWIWLAISLSAATLIHPTNIFLASIIFFYLFFKKIFFSGYTVSKIIIFISLLLMSLLCIYSIIINLELIAFLPGIDIVFNNIIDVRKAGTFVLNFAQLFSGTTVYRHISGGGYSSLMGIIDIVFVFVFIVSFIYLVIVTFKTNNTTVFSFVLSIAATTVVWYSLFSNYPLLPGNERYSLYLIMPVIICSGFLCKILMEKTDSKKILFLAILGSCVMITTMINNYFIYFFKTGGESDLAYRTNYIDPKKLVIDSLNKIANNGEIYLFPSSWWNIQPLRYLAIKHENIHVMDFFYRNKKISFSNNESIYIISFVGDDVDNTVRDNLSDMVNNSWVVRSYSKQPLMMIYQMKPLSMDIEIKHEINWRTGHCIKWGNCDAK